jgi:hypothetical protein
MTVSPRRAGVNRGMGPQYGATTDGIYATKSIRDSARMPSGRASSSRTA